MKFSKNRRRDEPEINFVPLIDVLLVILIFLMATTTYSRFAELKINLPTADANKQSEPPNEISVALTAAGQVLVNKVPLTVVNVPAMILLLQCNKPSKMAWTSSTTPFPAAKTLIMTQ